MPVLVFSPNGSLLAKTSIADAATSSDCANKTIVVTSHQVITTAIAWPSDRELKFEQGGYVTFTGAGALTGLKDEVKPEWFGAKMDGSTDDSSALMLAALSFGGKAGTVKLSAGVYATSNPVVSPSYIKWQGAGADWSYQNNPTNGNTKGTVLYVQGTALAGMADKAILDISNTRKVTVREILFSATGDPHSNTVMAISDTAGGNGVAGAGDAYIEYNHFQWFGGPVMKFKGNVISISHNQGDNSANHFIWIYRDSLDTASIGADNQILFNESGAHQDYNATTTGMTVLGSAVRIENGANNEIMGNELYNFRIGIELTGSLITAYNRVIGNRLEKHGYAGIVINQGSKDNTIANNHLFNNAYMTDGFKSAIYCDTAVYNSIIDNYIFNELGYPGNPSDYAIYLNNGSNNNQVQGNYAYKMNVSSYRISDSNGVDLSGNYSYNCQLQGIQITAISGNSNDNQICNNRVWLSGQATDNTYDAILIFASGTGHTINNTFVSANTVRHGGATIKARYGIKILQSGGGTATGTKLLNNDLTNASSSYAISDGGTSSIIRGNIGFNPVGVVGPPSVPASNTPLANPYPYDCTVYVSGGTVSAIGIATSAPLGITSGAFRVGVGQNINIVYTVAPTWIWMAD